MRRYFLLLISLLSVGFSFAQNDPVADPDAVVTSGHVRFTVLTPQLIRIQYSPASKFEDRATFAVVNRRLPVPEYTTRTENNTLIIETSALTLRYRIGTRPNASSKSPTNLSITFMLNGQEVVWYPGKEDALNLRGTQRTLDGNAGSRSRDDLEQGIVSRSGWALIDESPTAVRGDGSRSFPMEPKEEGGMDWVASPIETNSIDWYFFGYGHDYRQAVSDYTKIGGNIPLPPAYLFGYWYSRYWAYSQAEFMQIVRDIKNNDIPLDVMILDMDWHTAGWTGWTWNKKLIPTPKTLLSFMHRNDLQVALNLHPADGVDSDEEFYDVLSRDLGRDPSLGETIPWQIEDYDFYKAMFRDILRVRESEGVDFWWLDWQQYLTNKTIDGLGQTFWHNHVFFEDMRLNRTDRRPTIYHRWGGLGSHRYQIGFSGDTWATWPALAYQPYFTATASNVGYGYWGHDLGGHQQSGADNPEMYLRWMQYGVFSPIFRTHATNASNIERRIWKFPNFEQLRSTVILRYALFPYIYTYAREAYDTGICLCRPLYYEWPEETNAYRFEDVYYFGRDILVAPVVSPVDDGGTARRSVWLPEGEWYDVVRGQLLKGNTTFAADYTLDDIPYFYRAGSLIVNNPPQMSVKYRPEELIFKVVPGADGEFTLYEDEGDNENYKDGACTWTTFSQHRSATAVDVQIAPREGSFEGMPTDRAYTFQFLGMAAAPTAVSINGEAIPEADIAWDEATHVISVHVPAVACSAAVALHVEAPTLPAVSVDEQPVGRTYPPYDGAVTASTLWVAGSAVPGGVQQLEPYPDGTQRFHGTLHAGTLRIINAADEVSATRYVAPRYASASIITSESATRSVTKAEDADWVVPFADDNYRFTVNTSKNTFRGEAFRWWDELYIAGGPVADGQQVQWEVGSAQPFIRAEGNPNVFYWTGEMKNYAKNVEPRRFKLLAQKDWGPRSLHPFKQDDPIDSSCYASEVNGDNKWTIDRFGWYTLRVDVFRETFSATYHGTNFDPTNVSPMAVEGMDADAPCYDLSGHVLATPADGANGRRGFVVIQGGRKYLVR